MASLTPIGRKVLIDREANKLLAYQDEKGIWTIGVGHTASAGPPTPYRGMTITLAQSEEIFTRDIQVFIKGIIPLIKPLLKDHQFDALVSFAFNVGIAGLRKSDILASINSNNFKQAARDFDTHHKPPSVTARRNGEKLQFMTPYTVSLPKARVT
jgi:lysozyme